MTAPEIAVLVEKERLCQLGVDLVELYAGGMPAADMPTSVAEAVEQLEGVVLYALLLEAVVLRNAGLPPADVRDAARGMAALWRTRVPGAEAAA